MISTDHPVLYESTGILDYRCTDEYGYRLVVNIDPELARYYRSLIPKWFVLNTQLYAPHITVVRKEVPTCLDAWERYQDEPIAFMYSPVVHRGTVYWWLNTFSRRLEEIRVELGLPVGSLYTRPPEGFENCFHATLGNTKAHPTPNVAGKGELTDA